MVITCNFQWLLGLSCNRAIQFNSITNRVDASNLWCDYLDFWSQIFFGVFSCFEKSHSWLDGLHFQTVYCHYRPHQRGHFNRSWKNAIAVLSSLNLNWHFGTLNSKLKQIGKIQNIYFLREIERNMVGSRRWIGRNKRQIWYWKYPSRPQPAFSKSPSQINVRRKFLSNSAPQILFQIKGSSSFDVFSRFTIIMQLYQ